jgi:hypothetical protein
MLDTDIERFSEELEAAWEREHKRKIEIRAYHIWEREGRPLFSRALNNWLKAQEELFVESLNRDKRE